MSIESVMPPNHLILCRPFSSCLQSFPASGSFPMSQLFASGGQKYWRWRFCFSISPSKEYSGLIFFRMDWKGTLWSSFLSQPLDLRLPAANTCLRSRKVSSINHLFWRVRPAGILLGTWGTGGCQHAGSKACSADGSLVTSRDTCPRLRSSCRQSSSSGCQEKHLPKGHSPGPRVPVVGAGRRQPLGKSMIQTIITVYVPNSCCYSISKSCLTCSDPSDCNTPGFPVIHYLPKFAQTHVHWVNDAIQPSHPLSPSSPSALNLSQHQGLFQWLRSSHQMVKVLELQLQHQSFQWIFRVDFLEGWLVWYLCCPRDSQEFSSPTVQKHQLFGTQPSLWTNSHIHTWLLDKPWLWLYRPLLAKSCLCFLIHQVCHSFSSKKQASFNFMSLVTVCGDFGAQENKVCHCFHCLPIHLPWSDGTECHDLHFLNVEF